MRVGVLMPNWVGDVVMATPALQQLRERLAGADLVGILRPVAADVLAGVPWFGQQILYDRRSNDKSLQMKNVILRLREHRLDSVLLFPNSLRSAVLAWRSGVRERVGIARYGRRPLLTRAVRHPRPSFRTPVSAMEVYQHLVREWVGGSATYPVKLATTSAERQLAGEVWESFGWRMSDRVVVLNSGGAYGPAKDWPLNSFVQLSRQLVDRMGARVLMVCGPAERENARRFTELAADDSIQSTADHSPSIGRTKACIERAAVVVSTDSGPRHFAAGFQVPIVSLFGATDPAWSLNGHAAELLLSRPEPLDCQPCAQRTCPLQHHRCMTELTVPRVLAAVEQLWGRLSLAS